VIAKIMHALWKRYDSWICEKWLPLGLFVFLSGFFWAPTAHNHKVMVNILLLLPCLLSLLDRALWRDLLPRTPLLWMCVAFLVYASLVSLVLNGEKGQEFGRWTALITLFLIGVGLRLRIAQQRLVQLFIGCGLAAALAGVYAVYRDVDAKIFLTYHYRLEGYGTLYNALRSGMLFGAFAAIMLWCACNPDIVRWQRIAAFMLALLCLATMVLTGSRAPMLALVLIGVTLAAVYRRWWLVGLIVAGGVAVTALVWDHLFDRGTSFRAEIWPQVWHKYLEAPIFGVGLQRSPLLVITSRGPAYNEHNMFLALLRQVGIIGLVLYLNVALRVLVQGWRDRNQCRLALLATILQAYGLIALQVDGIRVVSRPADSWVVLWLPLALLLMSQRYRSAPGAVPATALTER
jgi:O-antigen ligase